MAAPDRLRRQAMAQRALGHTKADLAAHLELDHGTPVERWRELHFNELKARHGAAHRMEREAQ